MGHLGNHSENSEVIPFRVIFNFKDEQRKIKKTRQLIGRDTAEGQDGAEDELFMRDFLKHARSKLTKK